MTKNGSLRGILGPESIAALAHNIQWAAPQFDSAAFRQSATTGLDTLGLMDRGRHIARALRQFLPPDFRDAAKILTASMTPPLTATARNGLDVFFYLPHSFFVAEYGLDPRDNGGHDPFDDAIAFQHALTRRFTAEFSIRPFLIHQTKRTLAALKRLVTDPDPHVRRWCSEGTRPRLPWGQRLQNFVADPTPTLPILEALKDDPELYVRRSVANHIGDIAKDHPTLALATCERWLTNASPERLWVIRHALRHPARKRHPEAVALRARANTKTNR